MGTKYSSVSVASYNANPPSDDGSTTESNKVKWSTHKSKLTDPIKTALESINTALVTALDSSARAVTASDTADLLGPRQDHPGNVCLGCHHPVRCGNDGGGVQGDDCQSVHGQYLRRPCDLQQHD